MKLNAKKKVKIGLIGLGAIGAGTYVPILKNNEQVEVVGVCDTVKEKADQYAAELKTKAYYNYLDLFDRSGLEAVIIGVPHYDHTPISIEAFKRGLHVLCEKPIAVHVNDAKKMIAAYEEAKTKQPDLIFGLMFQERTLPFHKKIKDILDGGELGKLIRTTWINTKWFRSQLYYDSGDWRATWAGEGGGILTNQCPHNLDLYQWLFGLPSSVHGFAHIGKYHHIEVEDEVTAYFEHENGMVGHFIVTTAETPGTNRFEIVGEYGKLVYENEQLLFYRNRSSMLKFIQESETKFGKLESWYTEIPVQLNIPHNHPYVFEKFISAIHSGEQELVARGPEGINGVTLANAIMLSSFTKQTVELPLDADAYEVKLNELIQSSKYVKAKSDVQVTEDMSSSFSKA
ncbi:Gfo/Idh/MocA family oxidoreductase [Paenibacillus filicis]|uniref:Gfo/Idh/MocA family oxidoreductase n=1 Tax=Paenibacillus gyeongsangnamensis TaxID=3388067 RepID=A0ABT4QF12_9BACL|nr:Gfo/Idh/MocA family oxidoreductase [Paenibacillus filicis]MCZ8515469.1 Gfo/Idh/MocA family oxidoreductase [Paenibacillus filicis]